MRSSILRLVFLSTLVCVVGLGPQGASASDAQQFLIQPGHRAVFECGWGYGPIEGEHALHAGGEPLKVLKIRTIPPLDVRVHFGHKVTVREDDGGRYRMIINRGHQVVSYRDNCPGGFTTSESASA